MTYLRSGNSLNVQVSQKNKLNLIEFLPEQHQNQRRVRIHQDKQPGHRRSMA